jgi:hypothetical protein
MNPSWLGRDRGPARPASGKLLLTDRMGIAPPSGDLASPRLVGT